jgi:integrase
MRRSELLALRWSDVDLMLCQIYINRAIHRLHNGEITFSEPKTHNSKRMVSLSPSTAITLREHRAQQEILRSNAGLTLSDDDLVFSHYDGKPLLPDSITHAWKSLANRAGSKDIRLHDARHTHASLMLKQGIHPKIVQERLGHASIKITLDVYSHVTPGIQQAAANKFDEIMLPTTEGSTIKYGVT